MSGTITYTSSENDNNVKDKEEPTDSSEKINLSEFRNKERQHSTIFNIKCLHLTKGTTEISKPFKGDFNATEVYMNKTSVLKYTKRYLTASENDSLTSTIIDLEKIARLNSISKYGSSDYSIDSCNIIDISESATSIISDTFAKESSNEIIHIIKSDNTLKGSFDSSQSRKIDVVDMKKSKDNIQHSILESKIEVKADNKKLDETSKDFDSTQNKKDKNIDTINIDSETMIDSLESTQVEKGNGTPLYPKIEKIVVDMPTSSRDDMKYHAFLTNHVITTEDPLTLMLKSKVDELGKNHESIFQVKADKSFTEISLPNAVKTGKKTCVEEFRCFSSLTEFWDKLAVYFDISLKRMEISLTEKILSEIKRSYDKIEKYATEQTQSKLNSIKSKIEIDNMKNSNNILNKTKHDYLSEFIQCNIQNQIDKLPFKINIGDVNINLEDTFEAKQLKKPAFKQYLEIIKPLGVLNKETEAVYEDAAKDNEDKGNDNNLPGYREAIHKYVRFVRTNAIVISGVPVFFMALFFVYGIILLIIKIVKIYNDFRSGHHLAPHFIL